MQPRWLDALVVDMCARHPQFPRATVERLVTRTWRGYHGARVQAFVPVLVRREVVECLRYTEALAAFGPEFTP